jgi:Ca2+-binding RTX toxin-like protein
MPRHRTIYGGIFVSRTTWLTRIGVALFTTIAVGAVGTPAFAASTGTASVSGTKIAFKAGSKQTNSVTFSRSGRTITINDRVKIKAGKGCKAVKGDKTKVRCTTKKNPTQITAHLGDKNDALDNTTTLKFYGYGGSGDDKLFGGNGTDRLVGDSGNDRIWGNAGNDSLDGGSGNDTIDAGSGNDKVYGSTGTNKLLGASGNDTLYGGTGTDTIDGGSGNDKIHGNTGANKLYGGSGNDYVYGGSGNETLSGGTGNDYLYGYTGNDTLNGDTGNDTFNGGTGNDKVYGATGDDKLYGDAGNDALIGGDGNDKEYGGDGNDRFHQAAAYTKDADLFVGNAGKDEVTYYGRKTGVSVSNDGVTGNDGAIVRKWENNVQTVYQTEHDTVSTDVEVLVATDHDDILTGGPNDDFLYGKDYGDTIYGGGGDDYLSGGGAGPMITDSNQTVGTDRLVGGAGNDRIENGTIVYGDYDTPSSTPRPVGADIITDAFTISYEFADGPVTLDVDNAYRQDGQKDEGDDVTRYRNIIGSAYDDVLITDGVYTREAGFISGGAGDDHLKLTVPVCCWDFWYLYGGDGADVLDGASGQTRFTFLYGSGGESRSGSEKVDDGSPDVLKNGGTCYVHKDDSATNCQTVDEL